MAACVQVWKATVVEEHVAELLAVRPAAVAEAKQPCPELLRADLGRAHEGLWLDVLTLLVSR